MKRVFFVLGCITLVSSVFAQSLNLSMEEKQELMDKVVPVLQNCISNFSGSYRPGTTITKVTQDSETKFIIEGTCNYKGQNCGLVSDTQYKVTIYQEGSQSFGETCIVTPYCLLGVITNREWDCECRKWKYGADNLSVGAADFMRILQAISQH